MVPHPCIVSFYISGLRKDWISHLIKRDCIACCFPSCSFPLVHRQHFILMLSPIPGHPQFMGQARGPGVGAVLQSRESGPLSPILPQINFPSVPTLVSAPSIIVFSHRTQSLRMHDHFL